MAIALHGTPTSADLSGSRANGSTLVVTKPTGVSATDILLVTLTTGNSSNAVAATFTAPAGWTAIATHVNVRNGTANIDLTGFWALGNVASTTFTYVGSVNNSVGWWCGAFSGVDNTTPIDVAGTTNSSSGANTFTIASMTIATLNACEMSFASDWNSGLMSATGYTWGNNGATPNTAAGCLYNLTGLPTGATDTVAVTDSASATGNRLAWMPFALRPVAAASGLVVPVVSVLQAIKRASYF